MSALGRSLRLMIGRAIVRLTDDAKLMQGVQVSVMGEEARGLIERFQNYGHTSVPLEGAEAIAVNVGGSRSHMVVLVVDDRRYRKKDLQPGETALYTDEGDYVLLKRGRIVEVKAGTKLRVDAPLAELTGDLHVLGNITCDNNVSDAKGSMQEMRGIYNGHDHVETGGTTKAPAQEMT